MADFVLVLPTNGKTIAVAEIVVVGRNALGKILQILVLMASTKVNGCLIVTKDIILLSNIGKAHVRIVNINTVQVFYEDHKNLTKSPS